MGYDNMHRITSKSQHLTQDNVQFNVTLNVRYDLSYTYGTDAGKKFLLQTVGDVNYRTEETPGEDANVKNSHAYEYDANGNLIYVNTSREKKDGENDEKAGERKLRWDEENRLLSSDDNGFVTNYWHDADGERTVKTSGEGEQVYVNSEFAGGRTNTAKFSLSGGRTNTAKFSLYVSPYLDIPCWNFCIRPSYLPSAMSWTSWSARLNSLALNLPKVLASHTNQSATCFKVALASSANIFR